MRAFKSHYRAEWGPRRWSRQSARVQNPGPGKLLVELEATGVSFAEVQLRRGRYPGQPAFPFVPGYDLVGKVVALGPAVEAFRGRARRRDDPVGAWAEYVEGEARAAVPIPGNVSSVEAAAVIVNGVTAYRMLIDARVQRGDTVLVHGAGGGVGTLLVQLASSLGARVIGTGRAAQREPIEGLGAMFVDYRSEDVFERVRAPCPGGVAAVFDHVGGDSLKRSYRLLAPRGTLISYGSASTRDARRSAWTPVVKNMLWALWKSGLPGGRRVRSFDVWGRAELGLSRHAFFERYRRDLGGGARKTGERRAARHHRRDLPAEPRRQSAAAARVGRRDGEDPARAKSGRGGVTCPCSRSFGESSSGRRIRVATWVVRRMQRGRRKSWSHDQDLSYPWNAPHRG